MPGESELKTLLLPADIISIGEETTPDPTSSYLGGHPFAPAGTDWPAHLTFLGRFGVQRDAWRAGAERWVSIFLNEEEGYVEWGDEDHVTVWVHDASEDLQPLEAPEGVRVIPPRSITFEQGAELPYDKRLGDWQWSGDLDEARKRLTGGNNGQHSQTGGYPTVYGGYESFDLMENPGDYQLVVKLNRYPLRDAGVEVAIHDVLNVYYHEGSGQFFAEMQQ